MFNFAKKKVTPFQLAAYLAAEPSKYMDGRYQKSVNDFLEICPKYKELRNHILDEIQWIIIACGIISIRMVSDHRVAKEVISQLSQFYSGIHEYNSKKTSFTPEFLKELESKMINYLYRFWRGVILRGDKKTPAEDIYGEAMLDFANESMEYITGESRSTQIIDHQDTKLQERTVEIDELETYIFMIIKHFIPMYKEHFDKFKM